MSKTIKEERLRWVLPIVKKEVKLVEVAKVFPHGTRTLERWAAAYKKHGEAGLEPKSTARKTQENETPIRIKEHIIELRKRTKKCALKLHWQMKKEGLDVPPRTIGEIVKRAGLVRKYRVKRMKYKYIKTFTNYYTGTNKRSDLLGKSLHAFGVLSRTRHQTLSH